MRFSSSFSQVCNDGLDDADEARSIPRGAANEKPINMRLADQGATILPVDAAAIQDGQRRTDFARGHRLHQCSESIDFRAYLKSIGSQAALGDTWLVNWDEDKYRQSLDKKA
jgi:hypothetical protein